MSNKLPPNIKWYDLLDNLYDNPCPTSGRRISAKPLGKNKMIDKNHITKIIDVLYNECKSSGGDGDALWYSKYYTIEEILSLVLDYDAKNKTYWTTKLENKTISWGDGQEWVIITTDESVYLNAPSWMQFILKN